MFGVFRPFVMLWCYKVRDNDLYGLIDGRQMRQAGGLWA